MIAMWSNLKKWANARNARHVEEIFLEGWDFAAGRLLEGEPIEYVEGYSFESGHSHFDRGIEAAVAAWKMRLQGKGKP